MTRAGHGVGSLDGLLELKVDGFPLALRSDQRGTGLLLVRGIGVGADKPAKSPLPSAAGGSLFDLGWVGPALVAAMEFRLESLATTVSCLIGFQKGGAILLVDTLPPTEIGFLFPRMNREFQPSPI